MTKTDAISRARAGVTAGDMREILNNAQDNLGGMCRINREVTRRFAWDTFHNVIANAAQDTVVDADIATNILREFS